MEWDPQRLSPPVLSQRGLRVCQPLCRDGRWQPWDGSSQGEGMGGGVSPLLPFHR